jgi:hypothetical protein
VGDLAAAMPPAAEAPIARAGGSEFTGPSAIPPLNLAV